MKKLHGNVFFSPLVSSDDMDPKSRKIYSVISTTGINLKDIMPIEIPQVNQNIHLIILHVIEY